MFDFSGKGKAGFGGLFGETQQSVTKTVTRDHTIDGKNVQYWYDYAQGMTERARGYAAGEAEALRMAAERKANDAGLRAVIRSLMAELAKGNPNHPLLVKSNRDVIFYEFSKHEMDKILKASDITEVWPLERPDENQSE